MLDKREVTAYFDRLSAGWDSYCVHNDTRIARILDYTDICPNVSVLDVACGTGVLIPDYLQRAVSSVTAIDISPMMIAEARKKFSQPEVSLIAGDVETWPFDEKFERIMVYNALPHFPDADSLIRRLSALLSDKGRLCIAHGASRTQIDGRHQGTASKVSNGLMPAEELAGIMCKYLRQDVAVSDDEIYVVSGHV